MDMVIETIKKIIPDRKVVFVFDRGFADEKLMNYMNYFDSDYIIRVPKNSGIVGLEYKGKLSSYGHFSAPLSRGFIGAISKICIITSESR
jgi:transposase